MVALGDYGTHRRPLAQFSSMVCRIMATVACPGLRSGLWLHFCSRPFICSASLHALHLFSVLSPKPGISYMRKKNVAALLVIPSVTRDLTSDERFATPSKNWEIPRFTRNDNWMR